jgi:MFS family permease
MYYSVDHHLDVDIDQLTFLLFLFVFEVGSAICGAAQSSVMLIIGRAVAGMGTSGLTNGGLTIIAAVAPLQRRPGESSW